jgi:PST family polysaccharide transporter
VLAGAFQSPSWIFYREMRFARQRTLLAIEPIIGFLVTMTLGALGFGYWSLVLGLVAGTWSAAIACVLACPYRLRLRFERGVLRDYYSFSWPLVVASGSGMIMVQTAVILGVQTVGLAGVGAIGITAAWLSFADRADAVVTQTLYPAICAVRDRLDLLRESFTKSNRLALIWGMPFGFGLTLFAPDLVHYVLGNKWSIAIGLLQVFGVNTAVKQIGFNWTAYHRAVGDTRPMAVNAVAALVTFLVVGIPGMILWGLTGYAVAMCSALVVQMTVRAYFLARLFEGFSFLSHSLRAILPSVPAVGVVLLMRLFESSSRSLGVALAEVSLYIATTLAATVLLERDLLREVGGYLRAPKAASAT